MRDRPSWQRSYDAVRDRYRSATARVKQRLVAAYPTPIYIEAESQRAAENNWPWIIGIPTSFLLVMLIAFSGEIKAFFLGKFKRTEKKGRWVRDRSLGGKMVFVSYDDEDTMTPRQRTSRIGALGDVDVDEVSSEMASEARALVGAAPQAMRPPQANAPADDAQAGAQPGWRKPNRPEGALPEWWVVPMHHVLPTPGQSRDCRARAKRLIKRLEDEKVIEGRDYDIYRLVQVYQACKVRSSAPS